MRPPTPARSPIPPTAHRTVRTSDRAVSAPSNIQPAPDTPQPAWIPVRAEPAPGLNRGTAVRGLLSTLRGPVHIAPSGRRQGQCSDAMTCLRSPPPLPPPSLVRPSVMPAPLRHSCAPSVIPAPPPPRPHPPSSLVRPLHHSYAPSVIPAKAGIHATPNTRPQPHPPAGPPHRPHKRSGRLAAVKHPTCAPCNSAHLDSCLRRTDGGTVPNGPFSSPYPPRTP